MPYKLSDQTQGFLDRNAAHKAHHVGVVALGNQLHHINLLEEIGLLIACSAGCGVVGGEGMCLVSGLWARRSELARATWQPRN